LDYKSHARSLDWVLPIPQPRVPAGYDIIE
jgi:hypothetical protein